MRQSEYVPTKFIPSNDWEAGNGHEVRLHSQSEPRVAFGLDCVTAGVYRVTVTAKDHPHPPFPSVDFAAVKKKLSNDNAQSDGPQGPVNGVETQKTARDSPTSWSLDSQDTKLTLDWSDGPPRITIDDKASSRPIYQDLPHRAYILDGPGVAHYTHYDRNALHVGLGEKAAPMDLSNRGFTLSATDCFGYDVYRTDPMYKHIPLLISATQAHATATFSTSHARGSFSVGSEIDGMWGHYKVYRQDHGGLEIYILTGRTIKDVLRKYAELVGYPLAVPRWAFGYLAGGMKYSMLDSPRASEALKGFADKLREHDIPCSGFQLSSGYTVAEKEPKTRNVFTWNKHRFPDPKAWVAEYHSRGIRVLANVKPYILASHPDYERLRAAGAFFTDPRTGQSAEARLWSAGGGESGVGGHIDFTSHAGYQFWYEGVKELRTLGIACIWNDNNEFTIPNDQWQCALQNVEGADQIGSGDVGLWGRYMHTELMGRASHDAVIEAAPSERPFILTRAATAGTMRYCCSTWSGDNVTSWASMKGANALSLTAGFCLLHCYGHDIGGFEGPQPSPELLLRWIQLGIHSPRFAINCFKTSPENNNVGDVIEPWMYPSILPLVRKALRRRYELIPYIYSLMLQSHMYAEPVVRWIGYEYGADGEVWSSEELKRGEEQYLLGPALMVGGVFAAGVQAARLYLPTDTRWINLNQPFGVLEGGQWVDVEARWEESIPVLAKAGSAIPVGKPVQTLAAGEIENPASLPEDDYRALELFPPLGKTPAEGFANSWYEDDGVSPVPSTVVRFEVVYTCEERAVNIAGFQKEVVREGGKPYLPAWKELHFILPVKDERIVSVRRAVAKRMPDDEIGRRVFVCDVESLLGN